MTRYEMEVESECEMETLNETERGKLLYGCDGIGGDWGGGTVNDYDSSGSLV
ncbi:hypothetical protein M407DRAFT_246744 [Tulasnella calospora MUT 4182]|uniref:Uncharacterized protein n=1 Tax=Tulasnella calospora MUT 4182 TaxID=1051891 RepID=A0A0C3K7Q8_9AGAM|nr:hypothetical protein M407DRAFT_246744 [Tulasnella calospora MUT 4182]